MARDGQSSYKAVDLRVVKRPPVRGVEYTGKLRLREQPKMGSKLGLGNKGRRNPRRPPPAYPQIVHWGGCYRLGGITPEPGIRKNKK